MMVVCNGIVCEMSIQPDGTVIYKSWYTNQIIKRDRPTKKKGDNVK